MNRRGYSSHWGQAFGLTLLFLQDLGIPKCEIHARDMSLELRHRRHERRKIPRPPRARRRPQPHILSQT